MHKRNIFITGITGFLGSHIAQVFLRDGYSVVGLKRSTSDTWRCADYKAKVSWVNVDDMDWKEQAIKYKPFAVVHAAWGGVSAAHRNDLRSQSSNLNLLIEVLEVAQAAQAKKVVGFGSQAEYGIFEGIIDESFPANPTNAYGVAKLQSMLTVRYFCETNHLRWYWLRLFPCFGEGESGEWFIPMLTRNIFAGIPMDMTSGLQQYAYLYVRDGAHWIKRMVESDAVSGVYNVSSGKLISLKALVEKVIKIINPAKNVIKIGALPYRPHQSMIMGGDTSKLCSAIGTLEESDFAEKLKQTVDFIVRNPDRQG